MDPMMWVQVGLVAWGALLGAAQLIVRVTPSKQDDRWVGTVAKWSQKLRNILQFQAPSAKTKDLRL